MRKAAQLNSNFVMFSLGKYYLRKNNGTMKYYLHKGANNGSIDCMLQLSEYYYEVENNHIEMYRYLHMAINNGSKDALYKIADYSHEIMYNNLPIKYKIGYTAVAYMILFLIMIILYA